MEVEKNIDINEAEKQVTEGDFTKIASVLQVFLSGQDDQPETHYLDSIATGLVNHLKPANWEDLQDNLEIFAEASVEFNSVWSILCPLFERVDMLEFTRFIFSVITKLIVRLPSRVADILLLISSRAVQKSNNFYGWSVPSLYAFISVSTEAPNFNEIRSAFIKYVDFEPEATSFPIQESMKTAFAQFAVLIRSGPDSFITMNFVRLLELWSDFAIKNVNTKSAFMSICLHVIRRDTSLRFNLFRIKVLDIMIQHEEYVLAISPLVKILEKSLTSKEGDETDQQFENVLIADKEIARSPQYQEFLFNKSMSMLKICLQSVSNRYAYPEIAAPVTRILKKITEDPNFETKVSEIRQFTNEIIKNAKKVEKARETAAEKGDFKIGESITLSL